MARNRGGSDIEQMSVAWSREKLLFVFVASAILVLALVAGLMKALVSSVWPDDDSTPSVGGGTSVSASPGVSATGAPGPESADQAARDDLASRPMATTDADGFTPSPLSMRTAPDPISLPTADQVDDVGVVTGFEKTPEGAMAQLAAVEQAAVSTGSLPGVRTVIQAWAAPGGPDGATWTFAQGMRDLLDSAGLPPDGSSSLSMKLTPSMGQIKGSVGPGYVVICLDYVLEVALQQSTMVAVADCQRMTWTGDRWLIGSGEQPFQATSVWPGTDAAIDAGWKDLTSD